MLPEDTSTQTNYSSETNYPSRSTAVKSSILSRPIFLLVVDLILVLMIGGIVLWNQVFRSTQPSEKEKPVVGANVERLIKAGKITIAVDATFPPMEYYDEENVLVGYDVDLGNYIATELGIKAEFKNFAWEDIFNALSNKKVDAIMSSASITDERKLKFDFSDPYLNAGQVIITQKTNHSIKTTADLAGKLIAVQGGTTNEIEALKYTADDLVIRLADFNEATKMLIAGEVDAIFADLTGAIGIIDANPSLKIASDPFTSEFYGVVMRKGEEDLVEKINSILNTLRQRGILTSLKQKWLER